MKSEETLLKLLEKIRLSLAFKVKGEMSSHWWKSKRPYRKYLKKLGIEKIEYEIDRFNGKDNVFCITVWFKNEDWACLQSQDLMNVINRLKVILSLQEEVKGVKQ